MFVHRVDPLLQVDESHLQFAFEPDLLQQEHSEFELFKDLIPKKKQPIVCVHWLRGLCHKNFYTCDRLHIYDRELLPICQFYIRGDCTNPDCTFRHPTEEAADVYCIDYARGFCKRGPSCTERHVEQPASELPRLPVHVKTAIETHKRAQRRAAKYQQRSPEDLARRIADEIDQRSNSHRYSAMADSDCRQQTAKKQKNVDRRSKHNKQFAQRQKKRVGSKIKVQQ